MGVKIDTQALVTLRLRSRAPRIAIGVAAVVLSVVGLKSLAAPVAPVRVGAPTATRLTDVGAQFAAKHAALDLVDGSDTDVVADEAHGVGRRLITVAVSTPPDLVYVAVLVGRDREHRVVAFDPPAIVGAPPSRRAPVLDRAGDVTDAELLRVVRRVLGNYLRGERDDVSADLAVRARVAVPAVALQPRPADAVTWLTPGRRVSAVLSARLPSGDLVDLRYELGVVRSGGRWLISQIQVDPLHQEVLP